MKYIIAAGGSGGHINPALAIASHIKANRPGDEIVFVGGEGGMENDLVPREGYRLLTYALRGFRRSMSPKNIAYNIKTVGLCAAALGKAKDILRAEKPDMVVGTGGYASFPIVYEAAKLGIPTALHESNALPGVTVRMLGDKIGCIMIGFEDAAARFKKQERVVYTGNPIRGAFRDYTYREAREELQIGKDEILVVSTWGSLGGVYMNRKTAAFIEEEIKAGTPFRHIHGAGRNGYAELKQTLELKGIDLGAHPRVEVREYIHDMPRIMAAADLVLGRAGAMTISEICAIGRASILVPSPFVAENHQEKNAQALESKSAAVMLRENEIGGAELYKTTLELINDGKRRKEMADKARAMGVIDAPERIMAALDELYRDSMQKATN